MRDYTVALNAEYVVATNADALECEDIACNAIIAALKGKAEEVETYVVSTYKRLFVGHTVKVSVNMVVDVEANSYEMAYDRATDVIEDMKYDNNITLVGCGTFDAALTEDRAYLVKPKFAI